MKHTAFEKLKEKMQERLLNLQDLEEPFRFDGEIIPNSYTTRINEVENLLLLIELLILEDRKLIDEKEGEKWISVEDSLPEFNVEVFAFGEPRSANPSMGGAYVFKTERKNLMGTVFEKRAEKYIDENCFKAKYVTHWMPLPPPPKTK